MKQKIDYVKLLQKIDYAKLLVVLIYAFIGWTICGAIMFIGTAVTSEFIWQVVSIPLLSLDPLWDPLRENPRFQSLLEKK